MDSRSRRILAMCKGSEPEPSVSVNSTSITSATNQSLQDISILESEPSCFEDSSSDYVPNANDSLSTNSSDAENEPPTVVSTDRNENEHLALLLNPTTVEPASADISTDNLHQLSKKNTKKRPCVPSQWSRNKNAKLREQGKSYVSQKTKKVIPEKVPKLGILCHVGCRLKCSMKINEEDRQIVLSEFYAMNINAKNALLFKSIVPVKVQRPRKNARKHKTSSFQYIITVNGMSIRVCKEGFCNLYQIGTKKVTLLQKQINNGASGPANDKRGKHNNRPRSITEDVKNAIKQHISSFPVDDSHYSRNRNPNKKYLSPMLNISTMYKLYLEECAILSRPQKYSVKKHIYTNIFNNNFNLSFGFPKSDTCSKCDSGQSNVEHEENAAAGYKYQKIDKKKPKQDEDVCVISMDLMQTQPLPKLTTSKAFYLRQMWLYNFGIHQISYNSSDATFFFTWTENIATKGSDEIGSCLWLYFNSFDLKNKSLIIWSDSCGGQNKNFFIICLYNLIILKGLCKQIDHKFPEVGHTYLDSDRDFGRAEKLLRKQSLIYTPEQYRNIFRKAVKPPGRLIDMDNNMMDIQELPNTLNLINRKKDINKQKVGFRDEIKWIRVNEFGSYLYKGSYDEYTPFQKVDLKKNAEPSNPELPRKHMRKKLSTEKCQNLKDQLQFIPEAHKGYYENILFENNA